MKALRIDKEPAYQCQLVDIDEAQFEAELAPEGMCGWTWAIRRLTTKTGWQLRGSRPSCASRV